MSFLPGTAPKQYNPARPIQQLKKADRMCGSMAAHLLEITSFAYPQRLPLPDDHHCLLAPRDAGLNQAGDLATAESSARRQLLPWAGRSIPAS
jgi:hypothetical protein